MLHRFFDRWRGPKRYDPWKKLVRNSGPGIRAANEVISEVFERTGRLSEKKLNDEEPVALFSPREADPKFEEILSEVERELEKVCGFYDYRQLLFLSRLC